MTQQEILDYANKAQTKICEYADNVEQKLRVGLDNIDQLVLGIELLDFQVSLLRPNGEWTDAQKEKWITFMIERHQLEDIPLTDFDQFEIPITVIQDTVGGNYVTYPELNVAVNTLESVDDALDARITALENYDYSSLIPQSLLDDVAEALSNSEDNASAISTINGILSTLSTNLTNHINNTDVHIQPGERASWNGKVSVAALASALSGKSDVGHTHTQDQVSGLEDALNTLYNLIISIPTPVDGNDGVTPIIQIGTVETGPIPSVEIDPESSPEAPVFNFVIPQGEKGDPFQFDAMGPLADRDDFIGEDEGFQYLALDTGNYYILQAGPSWSDPIPFRGYNGWTPRLGIYTVSATKQVLEILGFTGGTGPEPDLGGVEGTRYFISSTGIVNDANDAQNIRGPVGDQGEKGDRFYINDQGTDRSIHDAAGKGFTFLNTSNGMVSFKLSDTSGDWSDEYQWTGADIPGGGAWGTITGDINDQTDLIDMVVNEVQNGIDTLRDGVPTAGDTLAKLYELMVSLGEFAGDHDASTGALPTVGSGIAGAIDKGDYWYVSIAGTITGFATMNVGDVIFARIANAGAPADFFYLPFASLVADASPTVSGKAKLYNDFVGNNTDGSVTQAAIKTQLSIGRVVSVQNISGAVNLDLSAGSLFILTITGNVTSFTFSNETLNKDYIFYFLKDTSNKTFTWATGKYRFPFGNAPTLTDPTTNGTAGPARSVDVISAICAVSGRLDIVWTPNLIEN